VENATFRFVKGHGTENDFVLLPDPDGSVHGDLSPALVAALCHRRAGVGGDGVMRVVRCDADDDPAAVAARGNAEWFMDYRNSDGSPSEMCGNGIRVFARYLADHEGVDTTRPLRIGTRAGVKTVWFEDDGRLSVDMGRPQVLAETKVSVGERAWPALHVSMGNPHAVAFVESLDDAGPLLEPPAYDRSTFRDGVNVEFVVRRGERHVAMRVHERGSGETRSCGTGACAAMVAAVDPGFSSRRAGSISPPSREEFPGGGPAEDVTYRVDVPGGELDVTWTTAGTVLLTGPAVLVARGEIPNSFASEFSACHHRATDGTGNPPGRSDVAHGGYE
jgi:diaminopimelate epimerase